MTGGRAGGLLQWPLPPLNDLSGAGAGSQTWGVPLTASVRTFLQTERAPGGSLCPGTPLCPAPLGAGLLCASWPLCWPPVGRLWEAQPLCCSDPACVPLACGDLAGPALRFGLCPWSRDRRVHPVCFRASLEASRSACLSPGLLSCLPPPCHLFSGSLVLQWQEQGGGRQHTGYTGYAKGPSCLRLHGLRFNPQTTIIQSWAGLWGKKKIFFLCLQSDIYL